MNRSPLLLRLLIVTTLLVAVLSLTSCVTRRTVSQAGHTTEEKYVIKRPLKQVFDSIEME